MPVKEMLYLCTSLCSSHPQGEFIRGRGVHRQQAKVSVIPVKRRQDHPPGMPNVPVGLGPRTAGWSKEVKLCPSENPSA